MARDKRNKLTVEASMRAGKPVFVAIVPMDIEAAEAVHALELLEAVERNLAGTGHELQQLGLLFLVEGADRSPKPLDLRRCGRVVVVFGVVLPVVNIDLRETRDEQFELLLVEDRDEFRGDDVMEACVSVSYLYLSHDQRRLHTSQEVL